MVGATICSLLLPMSAHGQADAQLDPDSPAGVEYQLPLEQARKNAARGDGDKPADRGRPGAAPLFGAGIGAAKAAERAAGGGAPGEGSVDGGQGGSEARGGGSGGSQGGGDSAAAGALKQSALPSPDDGGGSASLRIAGIALAVLLVGALLGLVLRRGLRQSGS